MGLRPISVGDWVRPAESSLHMWGQVVARRDAKYLVVEWRPGVRTTHSCEALELLRPREPDQLDLSSGSAVTYGKYTH